MNVLNTKTILAALTAGATLFLTGGLFYVLLLADFFAIDVAKDPPNFLFIVPGELLFGFLLALIFTHCNIATVADGAKHGAVIGFLIALAYGLLLYGSTTIAGLTYYLADAIVWAVRYAAAGAVAGWLLGRGK